ncbi:tripartite tricarboxylate transporter TctB family protein [Xanthobacteraceae bacterium A53D]
MTERRINWPDLLFGGFLIAVAAGTFAATWKLAGGTTSNMGPGFMPRALALILLGFGSYFAGRSLLRPFEGISAIHWRPLLGIPVAIGLFAFLLEPFGLALASLVAILAAAAASRETRFFEILLFGLAMTAASVFLFVKALSLPVPIWPW